MILVRTMTDTVDNLVLDLLEWLGPTPRPYAEVLDAWRTSCPRLPVWEEANDRGYIERHPSSGFGQSVSVSEVGLEHLRQHRVTASS
jgi:D-3-phosphoglycerate dehydrogenase / 2-oxoglutarate reductase